MAGRKGRDGAAQKAFYKVYAATGRYAKNRIRDLERHVKANPKDVLAAEALKRLKNGGVPYRRKKPHNPGMFKDVLVLPKLPALPPMRTNFRGI